MPFDPPIDPSVDPEGLGPVGRGISRVGRLFMGVPKALPPPSTPGLPAVQGAEPAGRGVPPPGVAQEANWENVAGGVPVKQGIPLSFPGNIPGAPPLVNLLLRFGPRGATSLFDLFASSGASAKPNPDGSITLTPPMPSPREHEEVMDKPDHMSWSSAHDDAKKKGDRKFAHKGKTYSVVGKGRKPDRRGPMPNDNVADDLNAMELGRIMGKPTP